MTTTLILILAASVAAVALIEAVMWHACSPRRDPGRHRPGRHTLARVA